VLHRFCGAISILQILGIAFGFCVGNADAATALHAWDFRLSSGASTAQISDSVGSVVATLNASGASTPSRSADGVVLSGTGPRASSANVGGYVELDFSNVVLGGAMTIELIVEFSAFNFKSRIFDCGSGGGTNGIFVATVGAAGTNATEALLQWGVSSTAGVGNWTTPPSARLVLGVRYHIVTTVSAGAAGAATMRTYINGVLKGEKTDAAAPISTTRSECYVGRSTMADYGYFSGAVASLKIYSGAMNQSEVTAVCRAAVPSVVCGQFFWDFRAATAGSTTITDSIGSITAQLMNGESSDRTATGILLDGVDEHLDLDLDAFALGGPMTIETVAKFNAFNAGSRLFVCANGNAEPDNIILQTSGETGQLRWSLYHANVAHNVASPSADALVRGVRYHIVATVSNSTMAIYVDGVLLNENIDGYEPAVKTRSRCYIGKSVFSGNGFFSGEVSSLKLYSGAMTQVQVTAAYKSAGVFLEFFWDFTNVNGATAILDAVRGVAATLKRGNGGELPTRTATGVVMVGSGTTSSSANAGGYVELSLGAETLGRAMTVEVVVVWNSAFNHYARLFDCGNGASDSIYLYSRVDTGELRWNVRRGSAEMVVNSGNASDLALGVRYHIVATVAGTAMRSYINGVLKGTKTDGWEPEAMMRANCYIGKGPSATDGFLNGEVSSLKLYSGAMTQADVTAAYDANFPFLEFYWDFRGGNGTTITDSVGGINATLMSGNGGDLPTRSATGVVMVGTGPNQSTDNAGGYIDLNLDAVVFGGAITVEVVVMWTAFNYASRAFDCAHGSSDNIYMYNQDATGELRWTVRHGTDYKYLSGSNNDLTLGTRHHIVTTVVGTTMRSYIDGVPKKTQTDGWEPTSMKRSNCYIGKGSSTNAGYLSGEVSSLKLYSGAMTEADVTAAYDPTLLSVNFEAVNVNVTTELTFEGARLWTAAGSSLYIKIVAPAAECTQTSGTGDAVSGSTGQLTVLDSTSGSMAVTLTSAVVGAKVCYSSSIAGAYTQVGSATISAFGAEVYVYTSDTACVYGNKKACCLTTQTSIVIDASVVKISDKAFHYCTRVATVDFSRAKALTTIGAHAFHIMENLLTVDMSPAIKLETIGNTAFSGAPKLAHVKLSRSIKMHGIHPYAFQSNALMGNHTSVDFNGLSCALVSPEKQHAFDFSCVLQVRPARVAPAVHCRATDHALPLPFPPPPPPLCSSAGWSRVCLHRNSVVSKQRKGRPLAVLWYRNDHRNRCERRDDSIICVCILSKRDVYRFQFRAKPCNDRRARIRRNVRARFRQHERCIASQNYRTVGV
jgi:hypothetical protein